MKRYELFFNFILVPVDIIMILLAFISAYFYRSQDEIIYIWPFHQYIKYILLIIPFWILIFALAGLYNVKKLKRSIDEFSLLVLAVSSGIMVVMASIFLTRTDFFSRLVVIYSWFFSLLYVSLGRFIIRQIQYYLYRYNIGVRKVIIVGNGRNTDLILKEIINNKDLGYKLIGIIKTKLDLKTKDNSKILGNIDDFQKIINRYHPDEVILADSTLPERLVMSIIDFCHDKKIVFKQIPNLFQVMTTNISVGSMATMPIIEFLITPLEGWGKILKRIIDIIGSLIALIIFFPLMIIIAFIIKLDSSGPVIYRNERVGEDGKKFWLYKFRSMKLEYCTGKDYGGEKAEKIEKQLIQAKSKRMGPVYKVLQDPRRTRFGSFIERTSLDELPQFFNSLIGNMSLVGPRPHQPREVANYKDWHKKILRIKPGITGMAQISGRSDLDFDDEARLDIYYMENWSLWLDFKIMLKTPYAVIKPRKYY